MSRDQNKMSKNDKSKASRKQEESVRRRKQDEADSSNSDNNNSDSDSDNSEDEMDQHEYKKFLAKMFPSKYINEKVKAGSKIKKLLASQKDQLKINKSKGKKQESESSEYSEDDDSESDYVPKKNKNKSKGKSKKYESSEEDLEEDESEDLDDSEESEDDDSEELEEESVEEEVIKKKGKKQSGNFNIILSIGADKVCKEDELEEEYEAYFDDEDEWETDSDVDTENEDDPVSSDDDSESEEEVVEEIKGKRGSNKNNKSSKNNNSNKNSNNTNNNSNNDNIKLVTTERVTDSDKSQKELLIVLKSLQEKGEDVGLVNDCIKLCNQKMMVSKKKEEKKLKKEKDRNDRIFKRILRDKNTMNDFEFFEKLEIDSQKKIIKELREINKITRIEKPYRLTLLEADIPVSFKGAAMKKIGTLRHMEPGSGEYYKIKNWVDTFMRIPFGKTQDLPICIEDGVDKCHEFMANALKTLDNAVYGLNDAKMQIMQMLGQLVTNPKSIGAAIAIHGPPGTGKTSLVKEGISKILNRPFAFIALGGATDSSFLEGHGYTYEGSMWGKIVQILIDSKCMNPVIYFDELDKISETPKGEEIAGILTHLTDTSQNSQFHDKYFAEIDFDLSKCLFIFSYNDESKINPILKDRMYRIQTKGYNQKQKTVISNNYLLPRTREQVKFAIEDIIIPDQTLHYIIDNHCLKEDGVRNLKRCLEIIYTKLNLYRLMRPGSNLFEEDMSLKVAFPFTVTKDIVDKLIKSNKDAMSSALYSLYA